jgi:cyclophilin family peptidyl-prolyl cis-trans isomerase
MTDRRQRQKEARAAKREAQKKADRRKEVSRRLTTAIVFGLVVVGVVVLTSLAANRGRPASAYEEFRQQDTACGAEQPEPREPMTFEAPERQADVTAGSTVTATVSTSCGDIVMELDSAGFPETVNSFVFLAREGFYDGHAFHRVYPDLVIQGGDPNADGTGGPGYTIVDEWPQGDFGYEIGTVAMANRGSRTTGSQFFMVVSDNGRLLTNRFNVLGRVVAGDDVIARILEIETTTTPGSAEQSFPLETVYIETVTIEVSGS